MKRDMKEGEDWTAEGAFKTLLNAGRDGQGSTKREKNGHLARIVNPMNEDDGRKKGGTLLGVGHATRTGRLCRLLNTLTSLFAIREKF